MIPESYGIERVNVSALTAFSGKPLVVWLPPTIGQLTFAHCSSSDIFELSH